MNTNHFTLHHAESAFPMTGRVPAMFTDAHALVRKALERWENEGGRVVKPEARNEPSRTASSSRAPGAPSAAGRF